jgi:protein SCO1/2
VAKKWMLALVVALLAPAACGGDDGGSYVGFRRPDALVVSGASLPDVTTGAPAGARFTFRAEPGHLLMVYFGFTHCPDLCPTTLAELRAAKRRLGDAAERVDLAVVTVDPARDTAEILNQYVGSFSEEYRVLRTDDPEELRAAESAFLASSTIVTNPDGTVEVAHTANLYAVDDTGTVVLEIPFGAGTDGIANDLELLLEENPA